MSRLPGVPAWSGAGKRYLLLPGRCPPHEEMMIEGLTDEEERIFIEAILDA